MRWRDLVVAWLLVVGVIPGFLCGEVTVDARPVVVERKTFDPAHPPADMPSLNPGEAAVTQTRFDCAANISYQVIDRKPQPDHCTASLKVRAVRITVSLRIVIWLPERATAKLLAHEEGHRQIAERVYGDAALKARQVGATWDGQSARGEGANCEAAEQQGSRAVVAAICQAFLDQTAKPASEIGDVYDSLTAHGIRREPAEDEAIRQAFLQYNGKKQRAPG